MRAVPSLQVTGARLEATPAVLTTITIRSDGASIAAAMTLSLGRVAQFAQRHALRATGAPRALYHSYREHSTTVTVALPIEPPNDVPFATPYVHVGELPSLRGWRFVHRGAYDDLPSTYARITEWLVAQGVIGAEAEWERLLPITEEYVSDPARTPASELVTYLYVPDPGAT